MCASCVTAVEATAVQAAGAALVSQQLWHRFHDAVLGIHRAQRAQRVYDHNCEFVAALGLDAPSVLGARPSVPHSPPARVPARPPQPTEMAPANG
jgi:hypothetical protein